MEGIPSHHTPPGGHGPDGPPPPGISGAGEVPTTPPYQPVPPYPTYPPPDQPYPLYQPYPPYYAPTSPPPQSGGAPWYVWLIGGCIGAVVLIGALCVVLFVAVGRLANIAISAAANETQATSTSSQSFTVSGVPNITVHNITGNVTVRTGTADTVTLDVTKTASGSSSNAAQRDLDNISVVATQTGDTISVQTTFASQSSPLRPLAVDLVITVPASSTLDLEAGAGDVEIDDVHGQIIAKLTTGNLNAQGLTLADGSHFDVTTGDVTVSGALASSASVDIRVSVGDVALTLPKTTAAHLDASATTGSVSISGWPITVKQSGLGASASGDMAAGAAGTLGVRVTTGSIVISAAP
jgi:hypothetical protein